MGGPPKTRNVTVRHLSFRPGTICNGSRGCTGINFGGQNERLTFEDLEAGTNLLTGLSPREASGTSAAVIKVGEGSYQSNNITIRDSRFQGASDTCLYGICGVDANMFFTFADSVKVQNVVASNFHGALLLEARHNTVVEFSTITNASCDAHEGCLGSYNDLNYVVRRNIFDQVRGSSQHSLIRVRRTSATTPAANVLVYNNTIIAKSDVVNNHEIMMGWTPTEFNDSYDSGNSIFFNNIVMNAANASIGSYAVQMGHCADTGYVIQIDHNNYWNNDGGRNFGITLNAACQGSFDTNSITNDPQLGPGYVPSDNDNPVCDSGTTSFVAPDGDRSSSYVGAVPCLPDPPGGGDGECRPVCYVDP